MIDLRTQIELARAACDVSALKKKGALPAFHNYSVFPGFCDLHVHFREPGFSYKETIATGTGAAARGGYTAVCTMPNLDPVPDCLSHLAAQEALIARDAVIHVYPYGAAHCEVNELLRGGYIHDGAYARAHGHAGICSESEWRQIERDLNLAAKNGCGYHVCHISCKESVDLIRQAKRTGVDVSCETAPHYLTLDERDLQEDGRFKMNPPLRLKGSPFGIVGLETAFPILYTRLVRPGILPLETLLRCLISNPRNRFCLPIGTDYSVWDLDERYEIDPNRFASKGRATPFAGEAVFGKCYLTVCDGKIVYQENTNE